MREHFDPSDPDEVEIVRLASEQDRADRLRAAERALASERLENERLRDRLRALGDDEF